MLKSLTIFTSMQNELKIALIQSDLVWENPIKNRQNFEEKIKTISEPIDIVVLPEMFTSGFTMQPENIAETMQGETIKWMQKLALTLNIALTGSLVIKENDNYYNRLLFVHSEGKIETYDKRHSFTLAGEDKVYKAGTKKLIVDYKGWRICPLICYDLRFPVWARNIHNYDVLLYVASWPKVRIAAWDALLKARAIENMSYTLGVNRIGLDGNNFEYVGHSIAYDYLGNPLSEENNEKDEIILIELNKPQQKNTREKLGFLNDRDEFFIRCAF